MSSKKEFTKEKTFMPDGRYLLYYNFSPETKQEPKKSTQLKQIEGEEHV